MKGAGGAASTITPLSALPPTAFDRRTRRHSPLSSRFLSAALGICHSRRLPTQRRRRSDPNGTSQTRSRPYDGASSSLSPGSYPDALVVMRRSAKQHEFPITDAVRLTGRDEKTALSRTKKQHFANDVPPAC